MVVMDHHLMHDDHMPKTLALVNPNLPDDTSGHGFLAAAGVVFVLVAALNRLARKRGVAPEGGLPDPMKWLDLAALGTLCDMAPLKGVNRALVTRGLKVLERLENAGLKALAEVAGIEAPKSVYHATFVLGPRLNAGGRIGDPWTAAKLLAMDDRAEAIKLVSQYKIGPLFTPPVVSKWEGPRGTLMLPNITGGANWQGGSFDPETKFFYIFSNTNISSIGLGQPPTERSDMLYVMQPARNPDPTAKPTPGGGGLNVRGLPLVKPPYGRITAIDMSNPDKLAFTIAHGDTPDNIKNHPALKGLDIPRTGRQGRIGVLTTKTLLIAGEGGFNTTPQGRGAYLRAYDKRTGADAGQVFMPAPQTGSPMTYMVNGTQYVTVSVSGPGHGAELLVYKLGQ